MNPPENEPGWWKGMTPATRRIVAAAVSLAAGLLVALMFHYLLYRVGLPSRPFIYVAF